MAQKKESVEALAQSKRIVMDDSFKRDITSLRMVSGQYSEAIIYGPKGYAIGRLILDPYSISLYSSKASDWSRINDLSADGYSLADALEVIAEEKDLNSKPKFFDLSDYQKMLILQQIKGDGTQVIFEDALEEVTQRKLQQNFPQVANDFYGQKF